RLHPDHRPRVEPVHLDLRVQDALRDGAWPPHARTAAGGDAVYLERYRSRDEKHMHIFTNPNYNFLRWRWHAVALSWVVILAVLFMIYTKGMPKGIEFAGGTSVIMQFDATPSVDSVRQALNQNYPGGGQDAIVQTYGDPGQRQVMVRVPQVGAEQGAALSTAAKNVEDALRKGNLGNFMVVGTEIVGPAVGEELTQKGIYAFILSLIGILGYI